MLYYDIGIDQNKAKKQTALAGFGIGKEENVWRACQPIFYYFFHYIFFSHNINFLPPGRYDRNGRIIPGSRNESLTERVEKAFRSPNLT